MQTQENSSTADVVQARSRRGFMAGTAAVAAAAFATKAVAQSMGGSTGTGQAPSDLDILNYALTLELLEATFYTQGLNTFTAADFSKAAYVPVVGNRVAGAVYDNLRTIRDHENIHVSTLTSVIRSLGGTPVSACTYNFGYKTPDEFLAVGMALENTGVMAYDGAVNMIRNKDLITAGATIATVEARHAAYLNLLNSAIPFPMAFDTAQTMSQILSTARQFIGSCPMTLAIAAPKNLTTTNKQISLDGTASVSGTSGALTYSWRVVSGSAALFNPTSPTPIVQFNGGTMTYVFELTVTDAAGNSMKDTVSVQYVGR